MIGQIAIGVLGAASIFLSQDRREHWRRWACICGLAGQPFWFWMAWESQQYGVLALCFVYAWSWSRGIRLYWMGKPGSAARLAKSTLQPEVEVQK